MTVLLAHPQRETWRRCTRHDDYQVSSAGQVRRTATGRVLRASTTNRGYLKVNLGRRCQVYVHQLVAEVFHGPQPAGHNVDHIDFDRTNNHASNLRWMPMLENSVRWNGRTADGRNQWLTFDDVPDDHRDLTDDELGVIAADLARSGW